VTRQSFGATLAALVLLGCDPSTRRPTFLPRPEAATTEMELAVPAATQALATALQSDSVPLSRIAVRDGYVETPWLDGATLQPTSRRPIGSDVVRIRGWVDPGRHGYSQLTVEVIYRAAADPSVPQRELETEVAYANPARARVRTILEKLGGKPVDVPIVVTAKVPPPRSKFQTDTATAGKPVPSRIPSPVSVDSGALNRGKPDTVRSSAPSAAPTQGQHAAPPALAIPPAPKDTAAPHPAPVRRDSLARRDSVAPPAVTPRTAPPAAPSPARHFTVQVAAVHVRTEADSIAAALIADGFPPQIVTEQGWLKVRVGDFTTAREARAMLARIKAAQGGAPFIVRR
jgi:cell division protein FtsN